MALVNFTNLDFNQIRNSIKSYLRSNSNFTDYDFEGSNLSVIIDILAYNTYITSYNANMVSNEVFIDSATLRENVISLAKNIGYVPRSRVSARSNISFFVNTSTLSTRPISLTLQKGFVCSSNNYTFCIQDDITVPVVDNIAYFNNIDIYEGTYINENFLVTNNISQRFILSNPNLDVSSLRVGIRDTQSSSSITKYTRFESDLICSSSEFDLTSESKVFFVQEVDDQRYELIFGDNVFGKKLSPSNFIEVNYVISSGEAGNGLSQFTYNGRILDNNGRVVTSFISPISTNLPSVSGQEIEDINSIKKYAPKLYSSQNRAVTARDYEVIVPRVYPEAESVTVFGGETLTPPRYGIVYISIKPQNGIFISSAVKENIKMLLSKYKVSGITVEILDLKYLYIEIETTVYYDSTKTRSVSDLQSQVIKNIQLYSNSSELNKYGARFKYSKFLKVVDDSSEAITSNITNVSIRRDLRVSLNTFATYEICYGNKFLIKSKDGFNIKSSGFSISGVLGTVYLTDIPDGENTGTIVFFKLTSETSYTIVRKNVGKIDYIKGEIILYTVNITETIKKFGDDPIIEISAIPSSHDVIGLQDLYLQLDNNKSVVDMLEDTISSGGDISGTTYITTSSCYQNDELVRS